MNFIDEKEYHKHQADLDFWWPHITHVLHKHHIDFTDNCDMLSCGVNPTYAVFLIDEIVIKFFRFHCNWLKAFNTEHAAHEYLIKDNKILAPRILASGELFKDAKNPWPYIVSTKIPGQTWLESSLAWEDKSKIAAEIGIQLRHIHALPTDKRLKHDHAWPKLNLKDAALQTVLPKHLAEQVDTYIAKIDKFDRCFVNGDMVAMHIFVDNAHLSGIIDWGDATITDRHYELSKLMNTFDWDKSLLKTVLEFSNWPMKKNFAKQSLGLAFYRQAVGLTQHHTFDVFYQLPDLIPLNDIATLDELADVLFAV